MTNNPFESLEARLLNIEILLKELHKEQQPTTDPDKDRYLTITEAAAFVNLSKHTLYNLTMRRLIPFFKHRQKLYFRESELRQWIESGRKDTASTIRQNAMEGNVR